jgi:dTDP-4-dehydrorhamnose 3,5-epimerase
MNISDIELFPLDQVSIKEGDVRHALKNDDLGFTGFGEAYFSFVNPGSIKAWKMHKLMTMNLIVPLGNVTFVFTSSPGDNQKKYRIESIGLSNYERIVVPPGIWFGFKGDDRSQSIVLNIASIKHNPLEVEKLPITDFNFDWNTLNEL